MWYVVDQWGNTVMGPFIDKQTAENMANGNPQYSVVYKG